MSGSCQHNNFVRPSCYYFLGCQQRNSYQISTKTVSQQAAGDTQADMLMFFLLRKWSGLVTLLCNYQQFAGFNNILIRMSQNTVTIFNRWLCIVRLQNESNINLRSWQDSQYYTKTVLHCRISRWSLIFSVYNTWWLLNCDIIHWVVPGEDCVH